MEKAILNKTNYNSSGLKKSSISRIILYIVMIIASITMLIPFLWMLSASIKPEIEVFDFPIRWIPKNIKWNNYTEVFRRVPFLAYYLNTIKVAISITILQLITCSLAAYSFAKINYPERNKLFLLYLSTMMIPYQVIMIPQFISINKLGLLNTHWALILLGAFSPFGVFLFRQFFMSIPEELSEAARIDGCSEFGIYARIIMPLTKPAIASLTIFTFVSAWNDFLGPLIYINDELKKTLQLGMRGFVTTYSSDYALLMAAAVLATIPTILVYIFAQDFFVEGIATTGLKG